MSFERRVLQGCVVVGHIERLYVTGIVARVCGAAHIEMVCGDRPYRESVFILPDNMCHLSISTVALHQQLHNLLGRIVLVCQSVFDVVRCVQFHDSFSGRETFQADTRLWVSFDEG